jgi:NAD(P)-dependent dehydrogenase (short-subunit alcohol dehydrogenase family)
LYIIYIMSSDDQHFLDILGGVSSDIKKFSANVFDATDRHIDSVASSIRGAFDSSSWFPRSLKPAPPPPILPTSAGYWSRVSDWLSRHKAVTAAVIAFVGTGSALIYYQRNVQTRRRRAKRAPNGARKEVVVIAGPAGGSVTKSLMLDLEKRGFIVYVVAHTLEEEDLIKAEGVARTDIRPFLINIADVRSSCSPKLTHMLTKNKQPIETQEAMQRFKKLLMSRHHAFAGASPHELRFVGLIIAPDLSYQSGPIETIGPELWSDALNTKVVATIAIAQAFLPSICEFKARLLVLTPNVVSSLKPAFHGMESTIVNALEGFTTTMRRELHTLGIAVSEIRLGNFDFSRDGARNHLQTMNSSRTLSWPLNARRLYAQNFMNQSRIAEGRGLFSGGENGSIAKATSPRELHHTVFDALTQSRPNKVYRVGRGSLAYDIVGQWIPGGVVGWVLGLRKVSLEELNGPSPIPVEDSFHAEPQSWEKVERE